MSASNRPPTPMLYLLALLITLCKQQEVASFPFPNGNKILQKPFSSSDIAATTRHRNLQEDEDVCSFILEVVADPASAPYCSCDAVDDTYVLDCILTDCPDCDLIQGVDTCALSEEGIVLVFNEDFTSLEPELYFSCVQFVLGAFDTAVCLIEDGAFETCSLTVGDVTCNSCEYVLCDGGDGIESYLVDCTNAVLFNGDEWNFCDADIPETSPFVAFGSNNLFFFEDCNADTPSPSPGINFGTLRPSTGITDEDDPEEDTPDPPSEGDTTDPPSEGSSTTSPSVMPSAPPSASSVPSSTLSVAPSSFPSESSTTVPSSTLSVAPSSVPSETTSSVPSSTLSVTPSSVPSETTSSVPSSTLSVAPSSVPSESLSTLPSVAPSTAPSNVPSATPSGSPSGAPYTEIPSATPSSLVTPPPTTSIAPTVSPAPSRATLGLSINFRSEATAAPVLTLSAGPSISPSEAPSAVSSSLPSSLPTIAPIVSIVDSDPSPLTGQEEVSAVLCMTPQTSILTISAAIALTFW